MPTVAPEKIDPDSLDDYLEVMSKSVFQTGLSWRVIENKWPGIKQAFHDFDIQVVANFQEKDVEDLSTDTRVVRNFRKILAIISNAQKIIELDKLHGSFKQYLRSHGSFDNTLKALHKDFKYMGPTGSYTFLYKVGEAVIAHEEFERLYKK